MLVYTATTGWSLHHCHLFLLLLPLVGKLNAWQLISWDGRRLCHLHLWQPDKRSLLSQERLTVMAVQEQVCKQRQKAPGCGTVAFPAVATAGWQESKQGRNLAAVQGASFLYMLVCPFIHSPAAFFTCCYWERKCSAAKSLKWKRPFLASGGGRGQGWAWLVTISIRFTDVLQP